jgi:hypothetical protein
VTKYRVQPYMDDIFEVLEWVEDRYFCDEHEQQVFKGSISDCEAWLRLHEAGYI